MKCGGRVQKKINRDRKKGIINTNVKNLDININKGNCYKLKGLQSRDKPLARGIIPEKKIKKGGGGGLGNLRSFNILDKCRKRGR